MNGARTFWTSRASVRPGPLTISARLPRVTLVMWTGVPGTAALFAVVFRAASARSAPESGTTAVLSAGFCGEAWLPEHPAVIARTSSADTRVGQLMEFPTATR